MTTIEIPVPDELYDKLTERARRNERSVEEQVLAELQGDIEEERRRRRRIVLEKIRNSPPLLSPDAPSPEDVIREIRDHDGRP